MSEAIKSPPGDTSGSALGSPPESVSIVETTEQKPKLRWGNVALWVVLAAVILTLFWAQAQVTFFSARPAAGRSAPTFDMQFFEGYEWDGKSTASLADMKGKVVVLNFWASWCVECRLEADLLEQAARNYGDDVVFVGIAYVDAEPNSLEYLEEFNITYPNAPDLRSVISDEYEITGVPETFFITKDGQVAHVQIGPVSPDLLFGQIDQLLAQ